MKNMSVIICLLNQNDKITELKETNYENEDFFQSLIEE